jgi:hypothetical protein
MSKKLKATLKPYDIFHVGVPFLVEKSFMTRVDLIKLFGVNLHTLFSTLDYFNSLTNFVYIYKMV